jgi:hypothetical protein
VTMSDNGMPPTADNPTSVGLRTWTEQTAARCRRWLVLWLAGSRPVLVNVDITDGGIVIDGTDEAIIHGLRHRWTPRPPAITISRSRRSNVSSSSFFGQDIAISVADP